MLEDKSGKLKRYVAWTPDLGPKNDQKVISQFLRLTMSCDPTGIMIPAVLGLRKLIHPSPMVFHREKILEFLIGGVPRVADKGNPDDPIDSNPWIWMNRAVHFLFYESEDTG